MAAFDGDDHVIAVGSVGRDRAARSYKRIVDAEIGDDQVVVIEAADKHVAVGVGALERVLTAVAVDGDVLAVVDQPFGFGGAAERSVVAGICDRLGTVDVEKFMIGAQNEIVIRRAEQRHFT